MQSKTGKRSKAEQRREALARQLRANLKRRKEQARARSKPDEEGAAAAPGPPQPSK